MAASGVSVGCLYRLSFPSGKSYIGITKRTHAKRFAKHIERANSGSSLAVHNAIRKYGTDAVVLDVLVIADWNYLKALEPAAIVEFGTKVPNGYNMTNGGEGTVGHTHTEESRAKMSLSHKGKMLSVEQKAKISAASKGKPKSAEHSANIGRLKKGGKLTLEHRQKLSCAHIGLVFTAEHRANIGAASRGHTMNQKARDALRAAHTGKIMSPASIAKQWATRRAKTLAQRAAAA